MSATEDAASLLALLRRTTEENWLQPLLDDPDSAAMVQAQIAIFARLGITVVHNTDACTISGSSGGQPGTSTLMVSRGTGGTTGTIPRGYPFTDARGTAAVLQSDIAVGSGDLTLALPLVTIRQTELVNTVDDPGFFVTPGAASIAGSSGILIAPFGAAGVGATTFQTIGPATPIVNGALDWLSEHGSERGLSRQPGEAESDYRQRIRNIPDVATPIAVADTVQAVAQQLGLPPFLVLEPFRDGATPALKTLHGLGSLDGVAWDVDFYDDTSGFVFLDRRTVTAYFLVQSQQYIADPISFGVYWDAFFFDDPVLGFPGDIDVYPPGAVTALLALATDVAAKKVAGVNFDVEIKNTDLVTAAGTRSAGSFAQVWTLTPTAGQIWYVAQMLAGHDSPTPSTSIAHHLVFDLEGGGTFTTPDFSNTWTEVAALPSARVTAIHGFLRSDGTIVAHLVGAARILPVVL